MPQRNASLTETPETGAEDWARPLVERQLAMLGDLAEIGLEVARAVERQAKAAGPDIDLNRLSMAYACAARAVRMTIALQSRLIEDLKAREAAAAEARAVAEVEQDEALAVRLETHKVRVVGVVERVIEAERQDYDEVSRLVLKAEALLDDEDLYDDVLSRPIGELVARICRNLGLSPDWPRLAEEAWAKKEIESSAAGSPFADLGVKRTRPPPLAGGLADRIRSASTARRDGGGIPPAQPVEGACGRRIFPSSGPGG